MKQISFLIKPASSLCNMECSYCFYKDVSKHRLHPSYGIMKQEVMEKLIDFAFCELEDNGCVTFAFQGGEPTLASLTFFESFVAYVNKRRGHQQVHYAMQSNGLNIDQEWAAFFQKHDMLVGISLDGYETNHDQARKDLKGKPTFHRVMKSIDYLRQAQVRFNILCVLSNPLAAHPQRLYHFLKTQQFRYVQLIPCMDHLTKHHEWELTPQRFYSFYHVFFALWYRDVCKGIYMHVNLFDNLLLMLQDQAPYQCGMLGFCMPQLVVESDGSMYPCDFYVQEAYGCGNVKVNTPAQVIQDTRLQKFLQEKGERKAPCLHCRYENLCHGGCKRMNKAFLSDTYCAYQKLLKEIVPALLRLIHRK